MSVISIFRQQSEAFSVLMLIKDRLIMLRDRMVVDSLIERRRKDELIGMTLEAIGYLNDGRPHIALRILDKMHVELSK